MTENIIMWSNSQVPSGLYDLDCPRDERIWLGECYVCFFYGGENSESLCCQYPRILKKREMSIEDVDSYDGGELPELEKVSIMYEYFLEYCSIPHTVNEIRANCSIGRVEFDILVQKGFLCLCSEQGETKLFQISDRKRESQEDA